MSASSLPFAIALEGQPAHAFYRDYADALKDAQWWSNRQQKKCAVIQRTVTVSEETLITVHPDLI